MSLSATIEPNYPGLTSTAECASCKEAFDGTYYQGNGEILCTECAHLAAEGFSPRRGRLGRFVKAIMLGSLAALAGAAVHYAVLRFLNINAALVTIFMGFLVGAAVRRGSGDRGGWRYQLMAVILTYVAIATAYAPLAFEELAKPETQDSAATSEATQPSAGFSQHAKTPAARPAGSGDTAAEQLAAAHPLAALPVLLLAVVVAFLALPIGVGIESPFSILIFGFGLYRAWQMNKRLPVDVSGPYSLGAPSR